MTGHEFFFGMSEFCNTFEEVILLLVQNIYKPTPALKNHEMRILKRRSGTDAFLWILRNF